MVNVALEIVGFVLIVVALSLVFIPLGIGAAGVGLIALANFSGRASPPGNSN